MGRILIILQFAVQVGLIGCHVKVPVTRQVEQDDALLAFSLGIQGLVDRHADGMGGFRSRDDAFGLGELDGGIERPDLRHCNRFDVAGIIQRRNTGSHAVVAQTRRRGFQPA